MTKHYEKAEGLNDKKDIDTSDYIFNQTMLRIKNPEESLDFYTRVLGMTLYRKIDFPDMKFTLYFLAMAGDVEGNVPDDENKRTTWTFSQRAMLELTHTGYEKENNFNHRRGNSDPKGFGHIGFSVPDVYKACERFQG